MYLERGGKRLMGLVGVFCLDHQARSLVSFRKKAGEAGTTVQGMVPVVGGTIPRTGAGFAQPPEGEPLAALGVIHSARSVVFGGF